MYLILHANPSTSRVHLQWWEKDNALWAKCFAGSTGDEKTCSDGKMCLTLNKSKWESSGTRWILNFMTNRTSISGSQPHSRAVTLCMFHRQDLGLHAGRWFQHCILMLYFVYVLRDIFLCPVFPIL